MEQQPKESALNLHSLHSAPQFNLPPPLTVIPTLHSLPPLKTPFEIPYYQLPPNTGIYQPVETPNFSITEPKLDLPVEEDEVGYTLYICKDDFEPITKQESNELREYLVSKIFEVTSKSNGGWAPNFTLKGMQSLHRYEVYTDDEKSKDWLCALDLNFLMLFSYVVYTKEEMWYERAAIWLPGHSTCHIEPLRKLALQNKHIQGVEIGKWKLVRKIVTFKGTRVYVDMPPASARALEKHKMMLSYELQKVNVFLKAVAVDKDAYDSGMRELSITDPADLVKAIQNSPMPVLPHDPKMVKICLKGNKLITADQAKQIKNMVIHKIFKYHQEPPAKLKTDFEKYGFSLPGYFTILPENSDSRSWLLRLNIGKLKKHEVVVFDEEASTKYLKVSITVPGAEQSEKVLTKLKFSNKGVKGLNFAKWKVSKYRIEGNFVKMSLDLDLDSFEALQKLNYSLDYNNRRIAVRHTYTHVKAMISKMRAEKHDNLEVANMDLASDDDDKDVIMVY